MTFELYYQLKEEVENLIKRTEAFGEDLNQLEAGIHILEEKLDNLEKKVKEAKL